MKANLVKFQLGKQGITEGVIESLTLSLKNHRQVRVSCLKASGRERENIKEIAEQLKERLPVKLSYRIVGFTIIFIKESKPNR